MKKINKENSPIWFETWKQNFKNTNGREARYKNDFSSDDLDGKNRREAIESSEVFDDAEYSDEDIRSFIDYYSNKNNGKYVPYCMAIVGALKESLI